MPAERVSMRHAREIIRLKFSASLPTREIAQRLGLAPSTVRETLTRVESAGLSWPLPEGIGDAGLEAALYRGPRATTIRRRQRAQTSHPRSASRPWPQWNGQGFRRTRRRRRSRRARPRRMARACSSTGRRPGGRTSALRRGCAPLNCASRRASKMSTIAAARGLDRALFQKLVRGRLDRRPRQSGPRRSDRRRKELAGLRLRPQSLPRQSVRPLSSLCQACSRTSRWRAATDAIRASCAILGRADLLILDDLGA